MYNMDNIFSIAFKTLFAEELKTKSSVYIYNGCAGRKTIHSKLPYQQNRNGSHLSRLYVL